MYFPLDCYYSAKNFNISNLNKKNISGKSLLLVVKAYYILRDDFEKYFKTKIDSPLLFMGYLTIEDNFIRFLSNDDYLIYLNNKELFYENLHHKKYNIDNLSLNENISFYISLELYHSNLTVYTDIIFYAASLENWYKTKQVFKFNYDFFEELKETNFISLLKDNKTIFEYLQYKNFYIDCSNLNFSINVSYDGKLNSDINKSEKIKGILISYYNDYDKINNEERFKSDSKEDEKYYLDNYFRFITISLINERKYPSFGSVLNLSQMKIASEDYIKDLDNKCKDNYVSRYILNILYYLCSENREVVLSKNKIPTHTIKNKKEKKDTKEIKMWDVGFRIGAAIHNYNKYVKLNESETSGIGSKKRPHVRKAHWHRYKTKDGYILKWLHPIFVNEKFADSDNMPVTFHK